MKCFYFGCVGKPGHFFNGPDGQYRHRREFEASPWRDFEIDGKLQPHFSNCVRKIYPHRTYCDCTSGPEGVSLLHHKDGWTALSMWDRSVDGRGACNSTFIFEGTFTFDEALALTRLHFPSVVSRFKFEIVQAVSV